MKTAFRSVGVCGVGLGLIGRAGNAGRMHAEFADAMNLLTLLSALLIVLSFTTIVPAGSRPSAYIRTLARTVSRRHSCDCAHLSSERIHLASDGKTAWEGWVEVFELYSHEQATRCYAWEPPYFGSPGQSETHTMLHTTSVDSPVAAVRTALAEERSRAVSQ